MEAEFVPVPIDTAISALASSQHGVLARRQLRALGLSDSAISKRVARGRLHRIHRGVFAVGHSVLGVRGRWMGAVLACGPGAVLSHASAAALWEIRFSRAQLIDVTAGRSGRVRDGLRIHRPRVLPAGEVTVRDGIPVTTVPRTILDMAARLTPSRLERLLDQAEIQQLTDYPTLAAIASAHPGHRGAGRLTTALNRHHAGTNLTRSDLEVRFRELCRTHGLPDPRVNQIVHGFEVDFLFAPQGLIVETDSWHIHKTRHAFERDRRRDAVLTTHRYRTLRITDRQLDREPHAVAETIRAALRGAAVGDRSAA